jgi:hypothetical protein
MSNAELLIKEIKALPEDYAIEALDFVGYLKEKAARRQKECPVCAKHRDPITGELSFNAETIAAFKEGDAMLNGEIPAKWHNSIEDLDKMLEL